jgi:cytochrome c-type biogenesis protein CcmF
VAVRGPNYDAVEALVEVTRDGKPVAILKPQKRHFWVQQTDNSQAAISVNWSRDLFVAMGNPLGEGAWSMRIQYKPLVRYIWLGALIMAWAASSRPRIDAIAYGCRRCAARRHRA